MAESITTPRRKLRWFSFGLAAMSAAIVFALLSYLQSDSFHQRVKRELIAQLERVTGGQVDLENFNWNLWHLKFDVDNLTIHGLEKPGDVPYVHIDHAHVAVKIISLLGRNIGLRELELQHPVIHLILEHGGETNQPNPKSAEAKASGSERLFALHMDRLRVTQGQLLLNDKRVPLDLNADRVNADISYRAHPQPGYSGHIQAGSLELKHPSMTGVLSQTETSFTVEKNQIHVSSLKWSSGRSQFEAQGVIRDFNQPRIDAAYRASVELRAVGMVWAVPELREGIADLNGTLRFISSQDFFSSGKLTLRNGAYSAPTLRLYDIDAASDYTIDVDRITLSNVNGRAFGGKFTGSASLLHWAKISPKVEMSSGRRKRISPKPQEGIIQLAVAGVELAQGMRAIFPAKSPLNKLRIASRAEGKLTVRWIESVRFADTMVDLSAQASPSAPASELPLTGLVQATYRGREDRLDVSGVSLAARKTRLNATGAIGSQSRLKVSLNSSDLSELQPILRALGTNREPMPAVIHGQASFNGTVTGKLASPVFVGHLQATDFDTVVPSQLETELPPAAPASTASLGSRTFHWDSLDADVNYSPTAASAHNVILKRGKAQISGSVTATLTDGGYEPDLPIELQLRLRDADLSALQAIATTNYPLTGTATGQATISGTQSNLSGRGHLQFAGGAIYSEPYRWLSADLQFRNKQLQARNVVLEHGAGRISGAASYSVDSQAFSFNLSGSNLDLAHVRSLQARKLTVGGQAQLTASGSGTVAQPSINARLSVTGLVLGGESAGDVLATAQTQGSNMHVEAHINTQIASANMHGDIVLLEDFPAELHVDLTKLDVDPLLRVYLPGKLTGHSSLSGKFLIRGPLKRPKEMIVSADIDQFFTDVQNVKLHNEGAVRFSVSKQVATIDQMHIAGTDTDITGTGKVELAGSQRLDLHATGHVNLAILQSFDPSISSTGQTTFALNATGTLSDPSFAGNVQVTNGAIVLAGLPNGLSDINGILNFDRNRLRVQRLTARSGGGELVLGGYITYVNGIFFDLSASGHDIRVRYPEGVSSQATADLRLVGTAQNSMLSGDATITKFSLTPQFDLATYVQRAKQTPPPPNPNSLIDNIRLDVHIVSTPELRVETSMARLSGDVDIRLRGTAARPSVIGRLSIAEGDITFNSTTYHLERGDVVFANPVRIEPVINVEASARVRDYDITMGFHGTPDKLNITYRSEPPLPSEDIIALLAFGRTRQETEIQSEQGSQVASGQNFAQTASSAILGEALNAAVSSRVQKLFGISRIKIDPNLGGTEGNPNARLTVEQQISKDLTVTYLTNLGQYSQQVVQVEYNINRNVSLVALRDYTGVLAIDLRIRQRKR